jgi:hypothetical protein
MLGNNPFGRHLHKRSRRRWEDNRKMDLKKIGMRMGYRWNWLRIVSNGDL